MKTKTKNGGFQWTYEVPMFDKGRKTLDDMSLILGMYGDYIATKTGYLVGIIETTGVNMDLLSSYEQDDIFDSYNAFLMLTVREQVKERHQYMELTIPVDMDDFMMGLKKKYIEARKVPAPNVQMIRLIASYIDYYSKMQSQKNMSTKKHLRAIRERIRNRTLDELEMTSCRLSDRLNDLKSGLESSFIDVDMGAFILTGHEIINILKTLINLVAITVL